MQLFIMCSFTTMQVMFINSRFRWDLYLDVVLHHCSWNRVDIVKIKWKDFLFSFPLGALRENPLNSCGAVYFALRNWVGVGVFADLLTRFRRDSWKSRQQASRWLRNHGSRLTKLHEPVGWVQFEVLELFTGADLSQIAREKSYDHQSIISSY